MKIGMFTDTYYPEVNGVANSCYELKKGLEDMGHTVYMFTVTHPGIGKRSDSKIFRISSMPFPMLKERRVGFSLAKIWKKRLRRLDLDIIHTHTEFGIGHLGKSMAKKIN